MFPMSKKSSKGYLLQQISSAVHTVPLLFLQQILNCETADQFGFFSSAFFFFDVKITNVGAWSLDYSVSHFNPGKSPIYVIIVVI